MREKSEKKENSVAIGTCVALGILFSSLAYLGPRSLINLDLCQSWKISNSQSQILPQLVTQYLPECGCSRKINTTGEINLAGKSSCSAQALIRGNHQKVVSFTFFSG